MPGVMCHWGVGGALTSSEYKLVMMAGLKRLTCLLHNYNRRKPLWHTQCPWDVTPWLSQTKTSREEGEREIERVRK